MKVTMALVADYATIEPTSGKVHVLGIFTRIQATAFPCAHSRMVIVLQVRPELGDAAEGHSMRLQLVDSDGTVLVQMEGPFSLPYRPDGPRPDHNFVLEMNRLPFPKDGEYAFKIYLDNQLADTDISLELVKV